ncbi:MAG TPA: M48 family metalloprotease [Polyangiaceae bacterium]
MELLAWAAAAFAASLLASWVGAGVALAPLRQAAPVAWVDRARLGFPPRAAARFALIFLPFAFAIAAESFSFGQSSAWPWVAAGVAGLAAFAAAFLVRVRVERAVHGKPVAVRAMLRSLAAYWTVMFPHLLVAIVAAILVGDEIDVRSGVVLGATAIAVTLAMCGAGVFLARVVGLARPASDRLGRAVAAASASTGVRPRAVYELHLAIANAFALPAVGMLLFTPPAVRALDDPQLAAIARHELGHVSEPRSAVAVRILNVVLLVVALVAVRPIVGGFRFDVGLPRLLAAVLVLGGTVLFARLVGRPFARRMEERADAIAARAGPDDGTYARALEAIYAANLVPAVLAVRGAHPHLYDRMVAAGVTPSWPRPVPPSRPRLRAALLACLGVTMVTLPIAIAIVLRVAGSP